MNKTQLYIQLPETNVESLRFDDTYLALGPFGLVLGLEFSTDVSGELNVGDEIYIDKDNKTINTWVDGPATILGITFSSIYPAPASLVFTDRPLQLPISFTGNESGTIYEGSNIQSNWTEVELSDNVPFPITFNIADVRQINNRNSAYSKTIQVPGTKNNNDVFKYIFDIQGVDNYDTRVKVKCSLVIDTIPVLEGYIQLDSIVYTDNRHWLYNIIIFGENANFAKEIDQNARLEDLDFSEFNHDFTINAVTQSWSGDWTNGYYYPLIDYNAKYELDVICSGFSCLTQDALFVNFFKPAIYVKQYWDKIFKTYGYTYESQFLNSEAFTNLIIPTNKKVIKNNELWRFNNSFKAGITDITTFSTAIPSTFITNENNPFDPVISDFLQPSLVNINPLDSFNVTGTFTMSDTASFFYDPQNQFTDAGITFKYINSYDTGDFKPQRIVLNLDLQITPFAVDTGATLSVADMNFQSGRGLLLHYIIYKNGVAIPNSVSKILSYVSNNQPPGPPFTTVVNGGQDLDAIVNLFGPVEIPANYWTEQTLSRLQFQCVYDTQTYGQLNPNDEIEIRVAVNPFFCSSAAEVAVTKGGGVPIQFQTKFMNTRYRIDFFPTTNGIDGTYFFNVFDEELFEGQQFDLSSTIPGNIKQIDFINSIINMFNLYLYQDKVNPKKIFIEPRDNFYLSNDILDWSDKLDIDKEIKQSPIVDRKKRVLMTYKSDKDLYNSDYKNNTNEIYGQFEYLTNNEINKSEEKIEIIFSPSPLAMRVGADNLIDRRYVYTRIIDVNQTQTAENFNKVESNIRILYRKKLDLDPGAVMNIYGRNPIQSGGSYNFYPYAGHLDDPFDPKLDLSFSEPKLLYYDEDLFGYTTNSLYKLYYKQFFEEIYGKESKTITAYLYLDSQDILDFDYRKLVYLSNIASGSPGLFRINKIEYDPNNKQSYKVELIKVLDRKEVELPPSGGGNGGVITGPGNESTIARVSNGFVDDVNNVNKGGLNVITGYSNTNLGNKNLIVGSNNLNIGESNLVSGFCNKITANNSIISGSYNKLYATCKNNSSIIGGSSQSNFGDYSSIISGENNIIHNGSDKSLIIGGENNQISLIYSTGSNNTLNTNNIILGGIDNIIYQGTTTSNTDNNILFGGDNNIISQGVQNSIIIGGNNITITQSNTTYLGGDVFINGNSFIGSLVPIKYATYSLTDSEIKNSFTTPITIITGATGIAYIPTMVVWETNFNTISYTTNTNVIIKAAGADDPIIQQNGLLAFTYSGIAVSQGLAVGSYQTQAVRGADIQFSTLTGNPATGNGTILLTLYYIEI
jgi:hypothetical protein